MKGKGRNQKQMNFRGIILKEEANAHYEDSAMVKSFMRNANVDLRDLG